MPPQTGTGAGGAGGGWAGALGFVLEGVGGPAGFLQGTGSPERRQVGQGRAKAGARPPAAPTRAPPILQEHLVIDSGSSAQGQHLWPPVTRRRRRDPLPVATRRSWAL